MIFNRHGLIAQLVEHGPFKPGVAGSRPAQPTSNYNDTLHEVSFFTLHPYFLPLTGVGVYTRQGEDGGIKCYFVI